MMKRRLLLPLVLVAAAVAVLLVVRTDKVDTTALTGMFSSALPAKASGKTKPICSQVIVPAGDCIPQHLANLPPDPGQAGMLTIEGIDSDKDGVRDDVQRYIVEKWGHSERAVQGLRLIAITVQTQVELGDSVSRDEAYEIAKKMTSSVDCYARSVDKNIMQGRALDYVETEVTNTLERFQRWKQFEKLTALRVYPMTSLDTPLVELCGYDPAKLPN